MDMFIISCSGIVQIGAGMQCPHLILPVKTMSGWIYRYVAPLILQICYRQMCSEQHSA